MDDWDQTARRLRGAYGTQPVAPLRDSLEAGDAAAAYAIQEINVNYWQQHGRRVVGHKVGLTAKAVQAQLGVDQPDFGVLFDDMQIADSGVLEWCKVLQPKAEAEVAIVLQRDLCKQDISIEDVINATDYAAAAIEIVDSRIAEWKITFADTVADNGSAAYYVLSSARKALKGLDLYSCGMVLECNGGVAAVGAGAACLGHPLRAAAWLANTLFKNEKSLCAGDVILTGALGPMVALNPGDEVTAKIGGLGSVSFRCGERSL